MPEGLPGQVHRAPGTFPGQATHAPRRPELFEFPGQFSAHPGWMPQGASGEHEINDRAGTREFAGTTHGLFGKRLGGVFQNGARTYGIEGDSTIVIQMPGDAQILTVLDLSEDMLILEGVYGVGTEFRRQSGISNLQQAVGGLWTDPDKEQVT